MPPLLGTFDMTASYVLALLFLPRAVFTAAAGVLGLLYLVLGAIVFFIPCVIATAQLGVMFPHEGSLYNWTHQALGRYWGFFIGLCFWLTGVLAMVTATNAFVTIIEGMNNAWLTEPWQQGLVILALVALLAVLGTQRFRTVQNLLNLGFCLALVPVVLMILAAFVWLATGHHSMTSFTHPANWSITPGNFALFGLLTLNYLGASGPLNMAGEIAERRAVTRHLLWGTVIVCVCYFVCAFAVLVIRGQAISNAAVLPFEVVTTVDMVLGKFVGDIVAVCLLSLCIWSALFYVVASSRVLLAAAIDQRIPTSLGMLNKYRVPASAIIFQSIATAAMTIVIFLIAPYAIRFEAATDLQTICYTITSAALTIVWTMATAFLFVNLLGVYLRNPKAFRLKRIFPMPVLGISAVVGFVACVLTIIDTLLNSWIAQLIGNDKWWSIVGGLTLACLIVAAIASMFAGTASDGGG